MAPDRRAVRSLTARVAHLLAVVTAVAIAVTTPAVLIVNGLRVVARDWVVEFEYGRSGFPEDRYGLTRTERTELALVGLAAISPGTRGVDLLREAKLPDGESAFTDREVAHMADVRGVYLAARRAQLILLAALIIAAVVTLRGRHRWVVPAGLLGGGLTTVAIAVLAVPILLLGFDSFFTRFHELFFAADSWRFSTSDTLIRLYPERFWVDISQLVAGLTLVQAVLLVPLSWLALRHARRAS